MPRSSILNDVPGNLIATNSELADRMRQQPRSTANKSGPVSDLGEPATDKLLQVFHEILCRIGKVKNTHASDSDGLPEEPLNHGRRG